MRKETLKRFAWSIVPKAAVLAVATALPVGLVGGSAFAASPTASAAPTTPVRHPTPSPVATHLCQPAAKHPIMHFRCEVRRLIRADAVSAEITTHSSSGDERTVVDRGTVMVLNKRVIALKLAPRDWTATTITQNTQELRSQYLKVGTPAVLVSDGHVAQIVLSLVRANPVSVDPDPNPAADGSSACPPPPVTGTASTTPTCPSPSPVKGTCPTASQHPVHYTFCTIRELVRDAIGVHVYFATGKVRATLSLQRGTVIVVNSKAIVIRRADGVDKVAPITKQTWEYRKQDLKVGADVLLLKVDGVARAIVPFQPKASTGSGSGSGSGSGTGTGNGSASNG